MSKIKCLTCSEVFDGEMGNAVCPKCKAISSLKGEGNEVTCNKCDFKATYDEYGYLQGAPSTRLDKLDEMQKEYVKNINLIYVLKTSSQ